MDNDIYVPGQNVKLKIAVFGPSQVGKTHFGLSGPGPLQYCYDAEGSLDAMAKKFPDARGIRVSEDRVTGAITAIGKAMHGKYGDQCGTFVLDSWTLLETDIRAGYKQPNDPKSHHEINTKIEQGLLRAIEGSSAVHMVVTAREQFEWAEKENGGTNLSGGTVGFKPAAHKKFTHAFDLVFRISLDKQSGVRSYTVYKTRFPEIFRLGATIQNMTWAHFDKIIRGDVKASAAQELQSVQAEQKPAAAATAVPAAAPAAASAPATAITWERLLEKHGKAGKPNGTLKAWLIHAKVIEPTQSKMSDEQRDRASVLLDELIELSAV